MAAPSHPLPPSRDDAQQPAEPPLKKMRVSELLGLPVDPVNTAPPPDHNRTILTASGEWTAADAITKAMPRDQGLPLTILTGFLGAGKSTVLNYILKADHGLNIAVLINEYGEVDIDNQLVDTVTKGQEGEPVILNNGCICCTVSNGFIDAVHRVLEQADISGRIPDYFIVETTGLADPKPIIDSVSATELREELYVDQVLTVVDSSAWSTHHYGSETARRQIESADTVLLSKTDLTDDQAIKHVIANILSIRPNARILRSQKGYVPIPALFDLGVSLVEKKSTRKKRDKPAKDGSTVANGTAEKHDHDHDHDHGEGCDHEHKHGEECNDKHEKKPTHLEQEGFSSISFVSQFPFSLRRFKDEFMDVLPRGVFRSKGLLWFCNYESRFVFHWSGSRYNVEEGEWPEDVTPSNQLVVIGRDLDKVSITKMLEACIVKPGEESEDEYLGEEDIDEQWEGEDDEEGEVAEDDVEANGTTEIDGEPGSGGDSSVAKEDTPDKAAMITATKDEATETIRAQVANTDTTA